MKDGGWLSKYNSPEAQNGIEGTMAGLTDQGFDYNGAWGGPSMQDGGYVDSVLNANIDKEWVKRFYEKNTPSIKVKGQKGRSTHLMEQADNRVYPTIIKDKTGKLKYLGDDAYNYADSTKSFIQFPTEKEALWFTENYKKGTGVLKNFQTGGSLPGSVGFTYARTQGSAPANGKYTKKTKASAQNGQEMKFYQEGLDWKPKNISRDGSVIEDDRGQWEYPGEITKINSNEITMQGVPYNVLGISDTGDTQMMQPGQDYTYDGESVTEYPMAQRGKVIRKNTRDTNVLEDATKWYQDNTKDKDWLEITDDILSAPQRAATYAITGALTGDPKYINPSDALNIQNKWGKLATDIVLDPTNLLGIGLASKLGKIAKGAKTIEKTKTVFNKPVAEAMSTLLKTPAGVSARGFLGGRKFNSAAKPFWKEYDKLLSQVWKKETVTEALKLGAKDAVRLAVPAVNDLINQGRPYPKKASKVTTTDKKPITNFEKRIQNPVNKIKNIDGTTSTHKMASGEVDGKYIAYPTIVEQNGKLVELPDGKEGNWKAMDYALKNKEYKEFKTEKEAQDYSNNGYKKGTPMEEQSSKLPTYPARLYPQGTISSEDITYLQSLNDKKINKALTRKIEEKGTTSLYGAEDSDMFKQLLKNKPKKENGGWLSKYN
jgi:hypothetical protein